MLKIAISNERQSLLFTHDGGPLEFGRGPKKELDRFVIEDRFVSRDQLRIEELPLGRLRLDNLGSPFTLADGSTIESGNSKELPLPVRLTVGYTIVEVTVDQPRADLLPEMADGLQTISRPVHSMSSRPPQSSVDSLSDSPTAATLAQWFETVLTVQRAAAGSDEFYQETAKAVVELVGLDCGLILLRDGDEWNTVASHSTGNMSGFEFSRRVLRQVLREKRTFFQGFDETAWTQSLMGVESVVASPIFDEGGEVLGVVYGSRSLRSAAARRGIQPLEAQLVQLLGGVVSAGLTRMAREAEATRVRAQFEQFCSPELACALERDPSLLDGHEREITVMFCDIRGYSRISERLGTAKSFDFLADVMERFTNCVIDRGGVIIDYYGDGLAAMWNAPIDQPDHAARACLAARDTLAALPSLNESWSGTLGMPLWVGIGINSGLAQVGNAGSWRRRKYGPRGHTVNLASRVEGATKQFGVPILISGSTRQRLPASFATRRLCQVRVVNIAGAVTLYELCGGEASPEWLSRRDTYEQALSCYESRRWEEACRLLDSLSEAQKEFPDVPTRLLSEQLSANNNVPPEPFDPIFELNSK